jgi:hypothetical protein
VTRRSNVATRGSIGSLESGSEGRLARKVRILRFRHGLVEDASVQLRDPAVLDFLCE